MSTRSPSLDEVRRPRWFQRVYLGFWRRVKISTSNLPTVHEQRDPNQRLSPVAVVILPPRQYFAPDRRFFFLARKRSPSEASVRGMPVEYDPKLAAGCVLPGEHSACWRNLCRSRKASKRCLTSHPDPGQAHRGLASLASSTAMTTSQDLQGARICVTRILLGPRECGLVAETSSNAGEPCPSPAGFPE